MDNNTNFISYSEHIEITGGDRIVEQLDLTDFAKVLFFGKIKANKTHYSAFLATKCLKNKDCKDWFENYNDLPICDQFFFLSKIALLQDKEDKEMLLVSFVMNFCENIKNFYNFCENPTPSERKEFVEFLAVIFGFNSLEKEMIFIAIINIFG